MKFTLADIPPRILVRPNTQDGIQNFGEGNVYPQITENAIKASGRATQCTNIFGRFVRGKGFALPFANVIVNRRGLTVDRLHRMMVECYKKHRGFSAHINYNMLGQVTEINPVPFRENRLGEEDEESGTVDLILRHPDWGREIKKTFNRDLLLDYDVYNPDIEAINIQAESAGGFPAWRGQIFWWSANGFGKYPESSIDPVLEDVISDYDTKVFRGNNITTNFLASHIFEVNEFESEDSRKRFADNLKGFQGAKKTSKILVLENKPGADSNVKVHKVDIQKMDDMFEKTEISVKDSIRNIFLIPPVLCSDLVSGKMGTAQEIQDAFAFMNSNTSDDRLIFEEVFSQLFKNWHDPSVIPASFQVAPLSFTDATTTINTTSGN